MLYCLSIKMQQLLLTALSKKNNPPETEKKNMLLMEKFQAAIGIVVVLEACTGISRNKYCACYGHVKMLSKKYF